MNSITVGDLYFLKSPIISTSHSIEQEKKLSYLLGTVSTRPAVVIRAPAWWDEFETVTVIPAMSKGNPALKMHLTDRYGRMSKAEYPFIPHNPYTVPVSRLGKYIGSLDREELKELLYAFTWIHDATMQENPTCRVPSIYQHVRAKKIPPVNNWLDHHDIRAETELVVDENNILTCKEDLTMNGFKIIPADTPVEKQERPKTVVTKATAFKPRARDESKEFPPSTFSDETLHQVASRFNISAGYYNNTITKRDPSVLRPDEIDTIRKNLTAREFDEMAQYYKTLTPFDAFVLGPRLPTRVLINITGFSYDNTLVLKSLCNYMRDMDTEEYKTRIVNRAVSKLTKTQAPKPADQSAVTESTSPDYKQYLARVKPWLNPKKITKMPPSMAELFVQIPMGMVKRAYHGTQFDQKYAAAMELYSKTTSGNK